MAETRKLNKPLQDHGQLQKLSCEIPGFDHPKPLQNSEKIRQLNVTINILNVMWRSPAVTFKSRYWKYLLHFNNYKA